MSIVVLLLFIFCFLCFYYYLCIFISNMFEAPATLLGDYLQDDHVYSPGRAAWTGGEVWSGFQEASDKGRRVPTLFDFMQSDMQTLRRVQNVMCRLLEDASLEHAFLLRAFSDVPGGLPAEQVHSACQHIVLELMGDLHVRFTLEYQSFPHRLVYLAVDGVAEDQRKKVASDFGMLKDCCKDPVFEGVIATMFPTAQSLLDDGPPFLKRWAEAQMLVTKSVEFAHRTHKSCGQSKGPAKPSCVTTAADWFLLKRIAVHHDVAVGRKSKRRPHIKHHPSVRAVIKRLKTPSKRVGIGGNPKYAWLNSQRELLKAQKLDRATFRLRVTELAAHYDASPLLQRAQQDAWQASRGERMLLRGCPQQAVGLGTGCGPWII